MNSKFILSAIVGLACFPFSANSQDVAASDKAQNVPIKKVEESPISRPKLPSRQHVECVYAHGVLHFDFTVPEGEAVLTVTDAQTGISSQYYFDTDAHAEVNIGYLSAASLEIHTDAGNIYEGIIDL